MLVSNSYKSPVLEIQAWTTMLFFCSRRAQIHGFSMSQTPCQLSYILRFSWSFFFFFTLILWIISFIQCMSVMINRSWFHIGKREDQSEFWGLVPHCVNTQYLINISVLWQNCFQSYLASCILDQEQMTGFRTIYKKRPAFIHSLHLFCPQQKIMEENRSFMNDAQAGFVHLWLEP